MELYKSKFKNNSPQLKSTKSLLNTLNTGYSNKEHNEIPVPKIEYIDLHEHSDSLMDTINTGFDKLNTIVINPPKPKQFVTLYKENYLGEFQTESDKLRARENLDVYGKSEVSKIVSDVINNSTLSFITKIEVEEMLQNLDFVNSISRSYVNYEIPNNLFKL